MFSILYLWPMVVAACVTLATVHGLASKGRGTARENLLFAVLAALVATLAVCEMVMMQARTPRAFALAQRWTHLPLFLTLATLVAFVRATFGTGRAWLAMSFVASRVLVLAINFASEVSFNYRSITAIRRVEILGATVSFAEGVSSPWTLLGAATGLLALAFVIDAARELWRREHRADRRRALTLGGALVTWVAAMVVSGVITHSGEVHPPYFLAFSFVPVVGAAAYELSRDLVRLDRVTDELRETERRLDLALGAADLGVWVWDLDRDAIWASPEARALFGIGEAEPLDFRRFLGTVHPDDRDRVQRTVGAAVVSGGDYQTEYRVGGPDGPVRWIAARGRADLRGEGHPRRMRGVVFDVTERERADAELRGLREALTHAARVGSLGQLTSALAHELSQPLGAILRNAEAASLLLDQPTPDLAELRAILIDIRDDDRRATSVIQRLRALLARGQLEVRELSIARLVTEVATLLRAEATARSVRLRTDVASALPPVRGDAVQIQQVLLNLVLNAMDAVGHLPSGERDVEIGARLAGDGRVELRVTDSGRGIPPHDLPRVFERFFTTKPGGLGLGLPVSRTIVEAHGGSLWAESDAARGATFRFVLPATPSSAVP